MKMSARKPYPQPKAELLAELAATPSVHLSVAATRRLSNAPWQWAASLIRKAKTLPPSAHLHVTAPNRPVPGSTNRLAIEAIVKRDA
jgi:hypothetical protein